MRPRTVTVDEFSQRPTRRRRGALVRIAGLLTASMLGAVSCSQATAEGPASTGPAGSIPPATIPPLDATVFDDGLAWISQLPTGTSIMFRSPLRNPKPDPVVALSTKVTAESLSFSPSGDAVVFASDQSGNFEIWRLPRGESTPINLTGDAAADGGPVWSPDGSQIAFYSNRSGKFEAWIMGSDGSAPRQLTRSELPVSGLAWSPDGTRLAFVEQDQRLATISVVDVSTGEFTPVAAEPSTNNVTPTWSPDGSRIAFASQRGDDKVTHIYTMAPDGSDKRRLTDNANQPDQNPVWSPDGSRISFLRSMVDVEMRSDANDIWVMAADGSGAENITGTIDANEREQAWSPDGGFIAFTSLGESDHEVAVVMANGQTGINVSGNPKGRDTWAAWDPTRKPAPGSGGTVPGPTDQPVPGAIP